MRWMFFALLFGSPWLLPAQKTPAGARWSFDPARKAWAVLNANGTAATDFLYQDPVPFRKDLAAARKGERYFLVRADGSMLPDTFDLVLPATEGYYFTWTKRSGINWLNEQGKDTIRIHREIGFSGWGRQRIYEIGKKFGLLDTTGQILTPPAYDELGRAMYSHVYTVRIDKKYGLLNTRGQLILPVNYESLASHSQNLLVFRQNGLYGTMDSTGNILLPAQYDALTRFYENGPFLVKKAGRKGALDRSGKAVIPPQYEDLQPSFSPVSFTYREAGKLGIIDSTGKVVAPARYDQLFAYGSGQYDAVENGLHGVVGFDGATVVPCRYQLLYLNAYGTYLVKQGSQWMLLGPNAAPLVALPAEYEPLAISNQSRQLFIVRKGGKYGVMDGRQQLVLPLDYDSMSWVNDSLVTAYKNKKCALLQPDRQREVTSFAYDWISRLDGQQHLVKMGKQEKYGLLDLEGKEICPAKYVTISEFGNHYLLGQRLSTVRTKSDDASGFDKTERVEKVPDYDSGDSYTYVFIDSTGREIPKLKFNSVESLYNGLARVKSGRKEGYIDADARLVFPVDYIEFDRLYEPYTRVRQFGTGLWGIRSAGQEVIPCQYDAIGVFFDGYAWTKKGETRTYVDEHNREPVLSRAEAAQQLKLPAKVLDAYEAFGLPGEENGWIRVRQGGKWGWIDAQGKEQIACRFDAATPFRDGRARVLAPGYYNDLWVNVKGEVLLGQ